jgi:hypothetical protein
MTMNMPRGKGRVVTVRGVASVIARCPLCGEEHRYAKGDPEGEDVAEMRQRGFTDEWLPCQKDLPGNFWRIVIGRGRGDGRSAGRRGRGGGST